MTDDPDDTADDLPDTEEDHETPSPAYTALTPLPEFEGRRVGGLATKVAGTRIDGGTVLHHGEQLVVVVVAQVDDVQHPTKDGTLIRTQIAKPDEAFLLGDDDYAEDLVRSLRIRQRNAEDVAAGRTSMEVRTDENGVVLTPGDMAGDEPLPPVPETPGDDELVVIYEDGTRMLWPDDYDPGDDERPQVGEVDAQGRVAELVDPTTGETLATWDPADDARQDREVVEDLVAARDRRRAEEIVAMTSGPAMREIEALESPGAVRLVDELENHDRGRTGIRKATAKRLAELETEPF